jgi:hypothetical protein
MRLAIGITLLVGAFVVPAIVEAVKEVNRGDY